jgi:hypothetical protein
MTDSTKDILVPNVDIRLLREQRDALLHQFTLGSLAPEAHIQGVISLLDSMLDTAEGCTMAKERSTWVGKY